MCNKSKRVSPTLLSFLVPGNRQKISGLEDIQRANFSFLVNPRCYNFILSQCFGSKNRKGINI